ncbi:FliC/FljB family flagellin [Vreelandella venusta]|uniref:Flagellin n=1 Tax=Vreelandella venusta TaxID=44935 RepID=A0ABX2BFY5_9GAMM|nr:FliC/FljB family flagellin [Halomonas venusta]AZM97289.1 FliC/FljB family flagellin [Halomonas venusta]MDX1354687.1 FliC/FljB family flagellin [Halomonas venusta]NPT31485.1 flagellin FliC [Halomonas venusta]QPI63568.1 FliC/FljB family flagellin [Halomonas venusta]UQI40047.1 FliC/FljB family flagellin [Halomonas venusta]
MSVINTNITSMIGQSNLSKSQSALTTSMERLSSGLRINSAKDDAAGQAIANRMSSQITGLSQAQRNANDGISVAQTAEGALNQVNDNLQRVRELTVQAQNGTNSQDDLQSIQDEINQRLTEIDRISEQTDFNGVKVLSEDQSLSIQVGANDGESIDVVLEKITSDTLNLTSFNVNGPGENLGAAVAADYEAAYGQGTGVTTNTVNDFSADLATNLGVSAAAVNSAGTAQVDDNGNWYVDVTITAQNNAEAKALGLQGIEATSGTAVTFQVALDPSEATVATGNTTAAYTVTGTDLGAKDLLSSASTNPMEKLDAALKQVDELRSGLGAVQNRFDSAITNLQTNETNLSAARSRIEDADYATEVANMTRAQILQQAGTSVLAQANQIPQNVLSLLG